MQDRIRKMVKLAKIENEDIFYKDFAGFLNITEHSFYNWLKGYYDLSDKKAKMLEDLLTDLLA